MKLVLKNARLSFPSLFKKATFNGEETKYEATFLLDKDTHADTIAEVKKGIKAMIADKLQGAKVGADRICLKDGETVAYDGYENAFSLKAGNNKRPMVINRDKTILAEDDNVIYPGCYVNAIVELWAQNNAYGKRINANLLAVQFVKDGEPFGDGPSVKLDDFEVISDDDDDTSDFF